MSKMAEKNGTWTEAMFSSPFMSLVNGFMEATVQRGKSAATVAWKFYLVCVINLRVGPNFQFQLIVHIKNLV